MASADWCHLAAGLIQRARLLEAVLADLYSSAALLQENLLPPALVFAARIFCGPGCGARATGARASCSRPPTSRAPPTAAGWCWPTAPRRPPAPARRSPTG
jgi:hypothetical protein